MAYDIIGDKLVNWHNLESAREQWPDAPDDDLVLEEILDVAQVQVMQYAGTDPEVQVPQRFRRAQLIHAKNMYTAQMVDSGGMVGEGDFQIRPHPLDWHVKQLIRPRRAVPLVR